MSVHALVSGTKREAATLHGLDGGTKRTVDTGWVLNGSTKTLVYQGIVPPPSNMIVLYPSSSDYASISGALICDGTSGTPNLISKFPRAATSSLLSTGGADTHSGSSHGSATGFVNSYSNRIYFPGGADFQNRYDTSHTHTLGSHTHSSAAASNIPTYFTLIPTLGGASIGTNAVFPGLDDLLVHPNFSGYGTNGYYLRFSTTATTGGNFSHSHATAGAYTSYYTHPETYSYKRGGSDTYYQTHRHYYSHSHSLSTYPSYVYVRFGQNSAPISFDDLPSETIGFFTTSTLPSGWSNYSVTNRLFRNSTLIGGATGGNTTHTHTGSGNTGGVTNVGGTDTTYIYDRFYTPYTCIPNHTHSTSHTHSSYQNHVPAYVNIYVGKKD